MHQNVSIVLTLIVQNKKACCNQLILNKLLVLVVTALGFKPKTFSSVVRCSIQLSYAAIFLYILYLNQLLKTFLFFLPPVC